MNKIQNLNETEQKLKSDLFKIIGVLCIIGQLIMLIITIDTGGKLGITGMIYSLILLAIALICLKTSIKIKDEVCFNNV